MKTGIRIAISFFIALLLLCTVTAANQEILDAHNVYRSEVGVVPLTYNSTLAASAQAWAEHDASIGSLVHSEPHGQYGENIARWTAGYKSWTGIVDLWGSEKSIFIYGPFGDGSSTTGHWYDVGHYTQIVWGTTTDCGCGKATNVSQNADYYVCQYWPPGNYWGVYPYPISELATPSSIGVWRGLDSGAGMFYLRKSPTVTTPVYFGLSTDTPLVGDWTGSGTDSVGVFRGLDSGAGVFYLRESPTVTTPVYFGLSTDTPLVGDWTGSGTDSIGVFRGLGNGAGVFYLRESPTVTTPVYFGLSTDTPFAWNDSGISKVGVFRGLGSGAGVFYLRESPTVTTPVYFGLSTDTPLAGDWTGSGTDSVGVFRGLGNGAGVFYLRESPTVTNTTYFGLSTDTPIAGTWD